MNSRVPLTEMSNQRLPRLKLTQTYGKKGGGNLSSQAAYRQLFGQNENDLEEGLAGMSLVEPKGSLCGTKNKVNVVKEKTTGTIPNSSTKKSIICREDSDALAPLLTLSESSVELFTNFGNKIAKSCIVEKIGEGSFAEVFKVTPVSSKAVDTSSTSNSTICPVSSILKVIPLAHPTSSSLVADRVSPVDSVAREVNLLKHLDVLHGFTGFASIRIVKGLWPSSFLDSFRDFRKRHRKRAMNEAPDQAFDKNQIYALIEMDNAGTEIALIRRPSVFQAYDIFWMTAILLVNAEEQLEFEHRDLHLSNICVKRSWKDNTPSTSMPVREEELDIDPSVLVSMTQTPEVRLGCSNLDVTIIDYTVARAQLSLSSPRRRPQTTLPTTKLRPHLASTGQGADSSTYTAFDTMSFASQPFQPVKDLESSLQFSTYKKCLAVARSRHKNKQQDKWLQYLPRTNAIWLGYLLRVLLHRARGRTGKLNILNPKSRTPGGEMSGNGNRVCKKVQEDMWEGLCEADMVLNGGEEAFDTNVRKDKHGGSGDGPPDVDTIETESEEEQKWSEEELERIPGSAGELLKTAVAEGWLTKREIEAFKLRLEERS